MPIRAMITDDDLLSRVMLCDLLEDNFPEIRIEHMSGTCKDSIRFLRNHKIDLLFLDIELPDGKGVDILHELQVIDFNVIVTTSYSKYLGGMTSMKILDSIIKPLTRESLVKSMSAIFGSGQVSD